MAITKAQTVLGFTTNAYAKVSEIAFHEDGLDAQGEKIYCLVASVKFYTDNTKTYEYNQGRYAYSNLALEDGTIAKAYLLLKANEFSDWTDC